MNFKKLTLLGTVIVLFASFVSSAQDLDEIIASHLKAHGGVEKWDAITSMKISGLFTAFSMEDNFFSIKTSDGGYYSELHLGKYEVKESFDGKKGWTIDPWQEIDFPRELNRSEIGVFLQKADFFTPFYHYKEKGIQVEYLGKKPMDGIEVFALKVIRPTGSVEMWYLDADTYLEYKCESRWVDFAYPIRAESYYDDFRTINGVVLPFFIERTFGQRDRITKIQQIDFNVPVNKKLFVMPKTEEIKRLAFLEGDWNVKVEVWYGRANRWYKSDSVASTIYFAANNLLQEKISYTEFFVQSKIIDYTYNSNAKKYMLSAYNGFSSDIELFEGNFTDTTFVVETKDVTCGDTTQNVAFSKRMMSKMQKDSFVVEILNSSDQGTTWEPGVRLSYFRKQE